MQLRGTTLLLLTAISMAACTRPPVQVVEPVRVVVTGNEHSTLVEFLTSAGFENVTVYVVQDGRSEAYQVTEVNVDHLILTRSLGDAGVTRTFVPLNRVRAVAEFGPVGVSGKHLYVD